jgi:hypothetical protein
MKTRFETIPGRAPPRLNGRGYKPNRRQQLQLFLLR